MINIDDWNKIFRGLAGDDKEETAINKNMDQRGLSFGEMVGGYDIDQGLCQCAFCREARRQMAIEEKLKKEAIKRHADELSKAVETLLKFGEGEPIKFTGFNFKLEATDKNLADNEAVQTWLRYVEKKIAKRLNLSEAWIHISVDGSFLYNDDFSKHRIKLEREAAKAFHVPKEYL